MSMEPTTLTGLTPTSSTPSPTSSTPTLPTSPLITATVTTSLNSIVCSTLPRLTGIPLTISEINMDSVTVTSLETPVVTPSAMVMPWVTGRLKEASEDVVAVRLSVWLTSFDLSKVAVTSSAMVMPWVTGL